MQSRLRYGSLISWSHKFVQSIIDWCNRLNSVNQRAMIFGLQSSQYCTTDAHTYTYQRPFGVWCQIQCHMFQAHKSTSNGTGNYYTMATPDHCILMTWIRHLRNYEGGFSFQVRQSKRWLIKRQVASGWNSRTENCRLTLRLTDSRCCSSPRLVL